MNDKEIEAWKDKIDDMTREEMASVWRFASPGHIFFRRDLPLADYFQKRFSALGKFSPEVSKE